MVLPAIEAIGRVGRNYRAFCDKLDFWPIEDIESWQMARIRHLLTLVSKKSDHYRSSLGEIVDSIEDLRSWNDMQSLPFLEKADLRNTGVDRFLVHRPRYLKTSVTTGSSGNPVTVAFDMRWWARSLVRRARLFARHGIRYGSREARFWGRGRYPGRRRLSDLIGNRKIFQFVGGIGGEDHREMAALEAYAPDYFYGYSSLLLQAARIQDDIGETSLNLAGIVRTAEMMSPGHEEQIARVFRCPVINEYGCSETEIIGFDCEQGQCHVDSSHVLIEAVSDEQGGTEAVVTDLDNDIMPLIRYRLGDYIELEQSSCSCGRSTPVIRAIVGRTSDRILILPDGRHKHAVVFAYVMENLGDRDFGFNQFRVKQVSRNHLVVVIDGANIERCDEMTHELKQEICIHCHPEFVVDVSYASIPITPDRKYTYFEALDGDAEG